MTTHDTTQEDAHAGAGNRTYILIGVALAVVTVFEVFAPGLIADGSELRPTPTLIVTLMAFAFVKAGLVAAFYMHLRYDSGWYTAVMALAVILITYFLWLLTFGGSGFGFDWFG